MNKEKILKIIQEKNNRCLLKIDRAKKQEFDFEKGIIPVSFASDSSEVNDYGFGALRLSHKKGHYDYSRLENNGKVFYNHQTSGNNMPIGNLRDIVVSKGISRGNIYFDMEDEFARLVLGKIERGVIDGVSMGFDVYEIRETGEKNTRGYDVYEATSWSAHEVSIVGIEADTNAGVGRNKSEKGDNKMEKENTSVVGIEPEKITDSERAKIAEEERAKAKVELEAEMTRKLEAEKARLKVEAEAKEEFTRQLNEHLKHPNFKLTDAQREHCEKARSMELVRKYTIENLTTEPHTANISVSDSRHDLQRSHLSEAILYRALPNNRSQLNASEDAKKFSHATLYDMARMICEANGIKIDYSMDKRDVVKRAMNPRKYTREIANFSADFSNILLDSVNKVMVLKQEGMMEDGWRSIAKVVSASDFKTINMFDMSIMPRMSDFQIKEGGAYKQVRVSDNKETMALGTYGFKFTLSRQAIINDDMSAFDGLMMYMTQSSGRLPMDLLMALLCSNPKMSDGVALFHASSHGANLLGNLAPSVSNYHIINKTIMKQRTLGVDGVVDSKKTRQIGGRLSKILCTADSYFAHLDLISNKFDIGATAGVEKANPYRGIELINSSSLYDALSDASINTNTYFGIADPMQVPCLHVAFLNGDQTPYVEENEVTDVDGVELKIRHDCGVGVSDYRGLVRVAYDG